MFCMKICCNYCIKLQYLKTIFFIKLLKKKRIIDTFAARDLQMPDEQNSVDSLSEYSLRKGYGLELRRITTDKIYSS